MTWAPSRLSLRERAGIAVKTLDLKIGEIRILPTRSIDETRCLLPPTQLSRSERRRTRAHLASRRANGYSRHAFDKKGDAESFPYTMEWDTGATCIAPIGICEPT